tara:strand:- start:497 stop:1246 length:750 start_codon:yes stop_codon:yes gene_type:complete
MKQIYILSLFSLLFITNSVAQTIFDWENATVNGTNIEQTVNGITAKFTVGTNNPLLINAEGFAGTDGFVVTTNDPDNTNATFTFSSPINITSIYAVEAYGGHVNDATWTFIPTGGTNSNVDAVVPGYNDTAGVNVILNWADITQFTVTNTSSGSSVSYGFDNIVSDFTLSYQEFNDINTTIRLFPNPSNLFLKISGLEKKEKYVIYSIIGTEVKKGNISGDEKIDISNFTNGLYFLKFDNGNTLKFIKE